MFAWDTIIDCPIRIVAYTVVTVCAIYCDTNSSNKHSIILFQKYWTRFDIIWSLFSQWTDILSHTLEMKKYPKNKCLDTIVGYSFIYYDHFSCETTIPNSEYTEEDVAEIYEIQLLSATLLRLTSRKSGSPTRKSIQL